MKTILQRQHENTDDLYKKKLQVTRIPAYST